MSSRYSRPPNSSLYVRNLHHDTRPEDLRRMFGKYGRITDVYIPLDYYTRESRGFAYVQFEDIRDAEDAHYYLDRVVLLGRELEVQFAEGDRKTPQQMRGKEKRETYGGGSYSSRRDYQDDSYSRRSRSRSPRRRRRRSHSRSKSRSPKRRERSSRSERSRDSHRDSKREKERERSRSRSRSRSPSPARSAASRSRSGSPAAEFSDKEEEQGGQSRSPSPN
ncbi:serine/arginine-rich splicing factor 10-like [Stylophora pistillata]|uniref:Serine/arginine-rich splicing factor 10 n=1 Tax=Stylophora pistillata TaxID=50429 RepID=A0A2B4S7H9_STYPI|nr:serine/arginine-rich splicing factor 10-like [Stylophora pistillata]PFX24770.1 Serine/arginine-rich splicing factor 12 [Stylophora pistillata]